MDILIFIVYAFYIFFSVNANESDDSLSILLTYEQIRNNFENSIPCGVPEITYSPYYKEDPDINYLLFTRKNPHVPCDLQATGKALKKCNFNNKVETKVLIHGYTEKLPGSDLKYLMKDEFLKASDCNVIVHNWTKLSQQQEDSSIPQDAATSVKTILIGLKLTAWISYLEKNTGANPASFHLLAHSLGSEVASFCGKTKCGIGKISLFDPAGQVIKIQQNYLKPCYTDAKFVEAIHTNAGPDFFYGRELVKPIAHIDYYPNGGTNQPKCHKGAKFLYVTGEVGKVDARRNPATSFSCNHVAAYDYYLQSFNQDCQFIGLLCDNYEDFLKGKCNSHNSIPCEMGYFSKNSPNLPKQSNCFLQTSDKPPYCINKNAFS